MLFRSLAVRRKALAGVALSGMAYQLARRLAGLPDREPETAKHVWARGGVENKVSAIRVRKDCRGWERASDHVPVIADYKL